MQKILLSILVLALAHSSQAFLPAAHRLPLRPSRSAVSHRPAMSLSIPDNVIVAASNAYTLLADVGFDSDGSKVDRLYNGKALTGAVEAPPLALPLLALSVGVLVGIAVPLFLKSGSDAFAAGRPIEEKFPPKYK